MLWKREAMSRLLLAAAFLSCLTAFSFSASAQETSKQCPGYILGPAPYKLRAVLEAFCIPAPATFDLDTPLQYGAYESPNEFVLAWQRVTSSNSLEPQPLRIMRYDKQVRTWATVELVDFRTEILPGFVGSCLGSLGDIKRVGALFYISIELSPSSGCQLVVSADLKLNTVLSGWPVAGFSSGAVFLQGSMMHFQPTHPLRLSLFDPQDATSTPIYPPPSDPLRAAYIKRLRAEISQSDRCKGENCESDPEQFESDLDVGSIAVDEKTGSFAFVVKFSPVGFLPFQRLKNSPEWYEEVVYFYRLFPGPIVHREFPVAELRSRYGTMSLGELLKPYMLARIFAN